MLVEEVRRELVSLRSRAGISLTRVRALTCIPALATVEAEMQRFNGRIDQHMAAYSVICCGAKYMGNRRAASILQGTLNIGATTDMYLQDRRKALRELLCLSAQQLKTVEAEAYLELAASLISRLDSPCRHDEKAPLNHDPEAGSLTDDVPTWASDLARLLVKLSRESVLEYQVEIIWDIQDQLPNLMDLANPEFHPITWIENVILDALSLAHYPATRTYGPSGTGSETLLPITSFSDSIFAIFFALPTNHPYPRLATGISPGSSDWPLTPESTKRQAGFRSFRSIGGDRRSPVLALAELLIDLDQKNAWTPSIHQRALPKGAH